MIQYTQHQYKFNQEIEWQATQRRKKKKATNKNKNKRKDRSDQWIRLLDSFDSYVRIAQPYPIGLD